MEVVFRGQVHADKYDNNNFIAKRLIQGFLDSVERLVVRSGVKNLHEVGCGEGHITSALHRAGYNIRGTDISPESLDHAKAEATRNGLTIDFQLRDLYDLSEKDVSECILCLEVLEHVPDPHSALRKLKELARPYLIVSVPREPLWRVLNVARGKYLGDFGNTPGHLNHWSSRSFREFVETEFDVVAEERPVPWTMLLCRQKSASN